jgi:amino acid transporter
MAWKHAGRSITESHYSAPLGVYGSYVSVLIVVLCLAGTLYTAIFPLGGKPNAKAFFNSYLAALVTIFLLGCHKVYTRTWRFGVNLAEVDLDAGSRAFVEVEDSEPVGRKTWGAVSRSCSYRAAGKGWILLE